MQSRYLRSYQGLAEHVVLVAQGDLGTDYPDPHAAELVNDRLGQVTVIKTREQGREHPDN
jgi:hypothetical protein